MNVTKEFLLDKVKTIQDQMGSKFPKSPCIKDLQNLYQDIKNDYFSIVVVGEFKNGKSTFINAMLGEDLLPSDVTPTTAAIHMIYEGDNDEFTVIKTNGEIESHSLTSNALQRFTAEGDFNPNEIKYIKIPKQIPLLKDRVVLIDTPGVNDINTHRSDITHQFIPRADAILLILDVIAPFKKTEVNFLESIKNKYGTDHIIFVANFSDRIDEEELEETLDYAESRLKNLIKRNNVSIYPISAKQALKGRSSNDNNLLERSGILGVESILKETIFIGNRQKERLDRFKNRLSIITQTIREEVRFSQTLSETSIQDLQHSQQAIKAWLDDKDKWRKQIEEYIISRKNEIIFMTNKSIETFHKMVQEDALSRIEMSEGRNIKGLVNHQLPTAVKNHFSQWLDRYSHSIYLLLSKLEQEVSKGLSVAFGKSVNINTNRLSNLSFDVAVGIDSPDIGNSTVYAGVLLGGASLIAAAVGGGIVIPIIGMAGLPFLQEKVREYQWEQVKSDVIERTYDLIDNTFSDFNQHIQSYIAHMVNQVQDETIRIFEQHILYKESLINKKVNSTQSHINEQQSNIEVISNLLTQLEGITSNKQHA